MWRDIHIKKKSADGVLFDKPSHPKSSYARKNSTITTHVTSRKEEHRDAGDIYNRTESAGLAQW